MNWQNIGLVILVLAAMAFVLASIKPAPQAATARNLQEPIDEANTPQNSSVAHGPQYLIYNQAPWAFAPPVGNFLPSAVAPGGVAIDTIPNKGCFTCQ